MQNLTTKVLQYKDCVIEYVNKFETDDWKEIGPRLHYSNIFCTKNWIGEGITYGDNGSPLVATFLNVLIGIASWNYKRGFPDVYTNVFAHIDWINRELGK